MSNGAGVKTMETMTDSERRLAGNVAIVSGAGSGQRNTARNRTKPAKERQKGAFVKTTINVTRRDEGQHRLVATGAATDPMVTVGASGRNTSGKHLVAVEVTIVPDGGPPAPVRRADARDIEATRRAQEEDAAMAAEDVLTQAEEAGALDPVG